jgi:hypothetical protein
MLNKVIAVLFLSLSFCFISSAQNVPGNKLDGLVNSSQSGYLSEQWKDSNSALNPAGREIRKT